MNSDGYLWIPGKEGDPDVTWTWLAGCQNAVSVYIDGERKLDSGSSDAVVNTAINSQSKDSQYKTAKKNITLSPGRHKLQLRTYTWNGWAGGYHVGAEYVLEPGRYFAWIAPDSDSGRRLEFDVGSFD